MIPCKDGRSRNVRLPRLSNALDALMVPVKRPASWVNRFLKASPLDDAGRMGGPASPLFRDIPTRSGATSLPTEAN
jgi:hypothetical protein